MAGLCARVGDAEDALLGALAPADRERSRGTLLTVAGVVADSGAADPCTEAEADLEARIAGRERRRRTPRRA